MKLGTVALLTAWLIGLPALAGTNEFCVGPDTDSDGIVDICDNCSSRANPGQTDGDQDGFGDACDCDYSVSLGGVCDGVDFGSFAVEFGTLAPPTNCEYDHDGNGAIDGVDFGIFATLFGKPGSGPACGNFLGIPCNGAACGNAPWVVCPGATCP